MAAEPARAGRHPLVPARADRRRGRARDIHRAAGRRRDRPRAWRSRSRCPLAGFSSLGALAHAVLRRGSGARRPGPVGDRRAPRERCSRRSTTVLPGAGCSRPRLRGPWTRARWCRPARGRLPGRRRPRHRGRRRHSRCGNGISAVEAGREVGSFVTALATNAASRTSSNISRSLFNRNTIRANADVKPRASSILVTGANPDASFKTRGWIVGYAGSGVKKCSHLAGINVNAICGELSPPVSLVF